MVLGEECAICHQYVGEYSLTCKDCCVQLCIECPVITKDPSSRVARIMAKMATYRDEATLSAEEFQQFIQDINSKELRDNDDIDESFRKKMRSLKLRNYKETVEKKAIALIQDLFSRLAYCNFDFTCNMCHLQIKVEY